MQRKRESKDWTEIAQGVQKSEFTEKYNFYLRWR